MGQTRTVALQLRILGSLVWLVTPVLKVIAPFQLEIQFDAPRNESGHLSSSFANSFTYFYFLKSD